MRDNFEKTLQRYMQKYDNKTSKSVKKISKPNTDKKPLSSNLLNVRDVLARANIKSV